MDAVLAWTPAVLFAAVLVGAAVSDMMYRKIPNIAILALVTIFLGSIVAHMSPVSLGSGFGAAGIALVVTYLLYHFGVFGAGDAKLFSSVALFAGLEHLTLLALATVLFGGLIAIGVLILRPGRAIRAMSTRRRPGEKSGIPYGVAIAFGALATGAVTPGFLPVA